MMSDITLREAVLRKCNESIETKRVFFEEHADRIVACAKDLADAFGRGGRLFVMGNGGSACDAQHAAVEFAHPIFDRRPALPAFSLCSDPAWLSAIGNDEDFSLVYAKLIRLHAGPGDVALGISTSGSSANVVRGLQAARQSGLRTVGFSGRDGGRMVAVSDHSFVVSSFSIHRIQETHAVLLHVLWDLVHMANGAEDIL